MKAIEGILTVYLFVGREKDYEGFAELRFNTNKKGLDILNETNSLYLLHQ